MSKIEDEEKKLAELKKQQEDILQSINYAKKERDTLIVDNANLQLIGNDRRSNIKILEKLISELDEKKKPLSEEINLKTSELSKLNSDVVILDESLRVKRGDLAQIENEYKLLSEGKNKEIERIKSLIAKLKDARNKEISELDKKIETLQNKIKNLNIIISDGELVISNHQYDINKLEKDISERQKSLDNLEEEIRDKKDYIEELKSRIQPIVDEINKLLEDKNQKDILLKDITSKIEIARKDLDKVLSKVGFLVKKEESLKGFEEYIKDVSRKYGLDYQPYE